MSEAGGTPSPVTRIDASRQEIQHGGPAFLPDGHHFLYHRASRVPENSGIYVGSIDATPESQSTARLLATDSVSVYVPSSSSRDGFLLFLRDGSLLAQAFDGRSQLRGEAIPITNDVGNLGSYGWFSASSTGALAFRTGRASAATVELLWFDRQGKRIGQLGPRLEYGSSGVQLSPDGKRVMVTKGEATGLSGNLGSIQGSRVWTADLSRAIFSRLNQGEGTETSGAISPDGHVAFSSTIDGAIGDLY